MMPNWCAEFVTFKQADGGTDRLALLAENLRYVYEEMGKSITENELIQAGWAATAAKRYSDSSEDWIGRLLLKLGIDIHSTQNHLDAFYLRGFVVAYEMSHDFLQIGMRSAWGPCLSAWCLIRDYYDLDFVLRAEESGCDLYLNTDQTHEFYPEVMKVKWSDEAREIYDEIDDASTPQEILEWLEEEEYADAIQDFLGIHAGNLNRHQPSIEAIYSSLTFEKLLSQYEDRLQIIHYDDIDDTMYVKYQQICQDLYGQPSLPVKWTD